VGQVSYDEIKIDTLQHMLTGIATVGSGNEKKYKKPRSELMG
jgi:hypothetical protein